MTNVVSMKNFVKGELTGQKPQSEERRPICGKRGRKTQKSWRPAQETAVDYKLHPLLKPRLCLWTLRDASQHPCNLPVYLRLF